MSGFCACLRRAPIGRFDASKPKEEQIVRWFCSASHERIMATMTEQYLERFEINAIVGALPDIGQALSARGLADKPFSQLTKDEICAIVSDVVKSYRVSLDREADFAKEIPF